MNLVLLWGTFLGFNQDDLCLFATVKWDLSWCLSPHFAVHIFISHNCHKPPSITQKASVQLYMSLLKSILIFKRYGPIHQHMEILYYVRTPSSSYYSHPQMPPKNILNACKVDAVISTATRICRGDTLGRTKTPHLLPAQLVMWAIAPIRNTRISRSHQRSKLITSHEQNRPVAVLIK